MLDICVFTELELTASDGLVGIYLINKRTALKKSAPKDSPLKNAPLTCLIIVATLWPKLECNDVTKSVMTKKIEEKTYRCVFSGGHAPAPCCPIAGLDRAKMPEAPLIHKGADTSHRLLCPH